MAKSPRPLVWVLNELDGLAELLERHDADGVVSIEERRERRERLARIATRTADYDEADAIADAVRRNGFESPRAQQLMRERMRRKGHLLLLAPTGGVDDGPDPDGDGGVIGRAA